MTLPEITYFTPLDEEIYPYHEDNQQEVRLLCQVNGKMYKRLKKIGLKLTHPEDKTEILSYKITRQTQIVVAYQAGEFSIHPRMDFPNNQYIPSLRDYTPTQFSDLLHDIGADSEEFPESQQVIAVLKHGTSIRI